MTYYLIGVVVVLLEYIFSSSISDSIDETPDTSGGVVVFVLAVIIPMVWPIIVLFWFVLSVIKLQRINKL